MASDADGTNGDTTVDECGGNLGEAPIVTAGIGSQMGKGFVHVERVVFGDHAFSLFDGDTAVQCVI